MHSEFTPRESAGFSRHESPPPSDGPSSQAATPEQVPTPTAQSADGPSSSAPDVPEELILPELSGRQFLVLWFLFAGPTPTRALRDRMRCSGVELSPSAFSQLMLRLVRRGFVHAGYTTLPDRGPTVRFRVYQATESGLAAWRRTRRFFTSLADPGPIQDRLHTAAGRSQSDQEFVDTFVDLAMRYLEAQR